MYKTPFRINALNVNCWSRTNGTLCEKIVTTENPEVICLTEMHLKDSDEIALSNYKFFGTNRTNKHSKNPNQGSGGIAILIRYDLYCTCNVNLCCRIEDNILGIEIENHHTNETLVVFCIYLPPDNCRYGQNNENLLNLLTIEMYKHS